MTVTAAHPRSYFSRLNGNAFTRQSGDVGVVDFFAGCGGSMSGMASIPGVYPVLAANHWKKAIESHSQNFPTADHYQGDIRDIDVTGLPYGEIFWASPECFPAGTTILTRRGLVAVEDVREGDEVLTHHRRWRPVVATMSRPADTVVVKGIGLAGGLETTPEHPLYARSRCQVWNNEVRQYRWVMDEASGWVEAKDMKGKLWSTPVDFGEPLHVPPVGRGLLQDEDFWWMVGRWLGDGSLRVQPGKNEVIIVCSFDEADDLTKHLDAVVNLRWVRRDLRTAAAFTACHRELTEWLNEHFGRHAYGKTIPAWALTLPERYRRAVLDGYLSADGNVGRVQTQMSTVSKKLAVGIRMLANSLGEVANLYGPYTRPEGRQIEGRTVSERPTWMLTWITGGPRHTYSAEAEGFRWGPVKAVEPGRRTTVYNITVADDESYIADGVVVHNCPKWSQARGQKRDYHEQPGMIAEFEPLRPEADERSRALMWDVPRYLAGMQRRGKPVLAGVVENVVDVRAWCDWGEWVDSIRKLGYKTRLIALNSMHAQSVNAPRAPQSRDRLYLAYWHESLRRDPDWNRWLRPAAWCPDCCEWVKAVQSFKKPGADMGRYRAQYVYRCPQVKCRNRIVEPEFTPAWAAIDWTLRGERIGDRAKPLAPKTLARIAAGIKEHARPITLEAAGNTFERRPGVRAWGVDEPLTTFTTTQTRAVATPPLLIPVEGRDGTSPARPVTDQMRTQTGRHETGLAVPPFLMRHYTPRGREAQMTTAVDRPSPTLTASTTPAMVTPPMLVPAGGTWNDTPSSVGDVMRTRTTRDTEGVLIPPFIAELRGGHSDHRSVDATLATVTASGNHHGLVVPNGGMVMRNNGSRGDGGEHCTSLDDVMRTLTTAGHQSLVTWYDLFQYDTGTIRSLLEALPTQTTVQGDAVLSGVGLPAVEDCEFRMLTPEEVGRGMAFVDGYVVLGNQRERVRQYGNAVTPPVSEVIVSALVECIRGERLDYGQAA
jgi:DNA (cytosine-5)-methyltransferase 1